MVCFSSVCEHGRQRGACKDCGGSSVCEHGRQRATCKDCGGSSVCEHGKQRRQCKDCGGKAVCEHGIQRRQFEDCGEEDTEKETKDNFKRVSQLRKEFVIRVVSNYSPSIAILIGKYFFNNK